MQVNCGELYKYARGRESDCLGMCTDYGVCTYIGSLMGGEHEGDRHFGACTPLETRQVKNPIHGSGTVRACRALASAPKDSYFR